MTQAEQPRELYAAMAQAFDELTYLRKSGEGQHAAVSHDAVKRAVRRAFQRAGLLLFPTEVERTTEACSYTTKSGSNSGYLTTVVIDFRVVHAKTGQEATMRASGQGFDTTDSGSTKAWSRAIKSWAIATFLIESGFESEKDDDDQAIDKDSIEQSFKRIKQELYSVAPSRDVADKKFADIIGYYQTHSKRPVEDPREFQTRAHARQAFAALQQAVDIWSGQRFEKEAKKEQPPKRDKLKITDEDVPPILRGEPTEAELDAHREELLEVLRAFDAAAGVLEEVGCLHSTVQARRVAAYWQLDLEEHAQELADEWNDCGHPDIEPIEDIEWNSAAIYAANEAKC